MHYLLSMTQTPNSCVIKRPLRAATHSPISYTCVRSPSQGASFAPPLRPLGAVFPDTREQGYAYQTHPRTKGSTAYPDAIRDTDYFKDPGSGWQAMPSDLSSPCLCERVFKTVDDMNNLGLRKRLIGEVDVFQLDTTHELYGHMNVNYVRIPAVPSYDNLRPTATREKFSFPIRS
jgi:hypothetical protein